MNLVSPGNMQVYRTISVTMYQTRRLKCILYIDYRY